MHKAGFVNIIGNPNVGKSTLMNSLVGENLSIITSKAQTTRHRIMGIVNGDDFQIVYSDTPGVLQPNYKLQESMMKFVNSALEDADLLLYITDVNETIDKNSEFLERIKTTTIPVLLLINKVDLIDQDKTAEMIEQWHAILPNAKILPISALHKFNLEPLFEKIIDLLPENPAFYPKDELTDKPVKFFVSEIIREKILIIYQKEIPYSVEVAIEEYKEDVPLEKKAGTITRIRALIFVTRDSQKGIIIGHKGEKLKKVGTYARLDIEKFIGKKVFLEIFVKVNKDWRNKDQSLRNFGY